MSEASHVGFIGLGNIGTPMALSLLNAGFSVRVTDVRPDAAGECVAAGAEFVKHNRELAKCTWVGVAVVDDAQLKDLMLTPGAGLIDSLAAGATIIVHSTVLPASIREVAGAAALKGIRVLDAPVSGGDRRARDGDLAVMVGGSRGDFEHCGRYFTAIGRRALHMGELGSGAGAKIAVQMMTLGNWIAAMEAMRLARAIGIDESTLATLGTDATSDSWVIRTWGNYDRVAREHRLAGSPGLYRMFDKDLFNAVALAREVDVELPLTALGSAILAPAVKERLEAQRGPRE